MRLSADVHFVIHTCEQIFVGTVSEFPLEAHVKEPVAWCEKIFHGIIQLSWLVNMVPNELHFF